MQPEKFVARRLKFPARCHLLIMEEMELIYDTMIKYLLFKLIYYIQIVFFSTKKILKIKYLILSILQRKYLHSPGIRVTFFTSEEKLRDEVDAAIDALFGATFVYFEY